MTYYTWKNHPWEQVVLRDEGKADTKCKSYSSLFYYNSYPQVDKVLDLIAVG